MSRRKHFKAEKLKCREMIDEMLNDGYTYEEIERAVSEKGEEIAISSLSRYNKSFQLAAEKVLKLQESMKVFLEATKDRPDTDMAKMANSMIMQGIIERLISSNIGEEMKDADINEVAKTLAALERTSIRREQLKIKYQKAVDDATKILKEQVKQDLRNDKELAEKLEAHIENARNTMQQAVR